MIDTPFKSVPLKDVIYFQEGPGLRNWQYGSSGVPFLNIRTITDEGVIDKSLCQYVKQDEFEGKYEHFLLEEGDYVVSSSGTLGKLAEIRAQDLPLMLNTSVIRFRPLNPEVLDRAYLKWFIKSPLYIRQIQKASTGTAIKNYGPSHLKQMVIPLPPLEEQRRIVAILDKADAVRRKRQQAIALTEELLRSAFLEMFGDPIANSKGWEVIELGNLLTFLTSGSRGWAKFYAPEGRLFLRIQNVKDGKLLLDDIAYIDPPDSAEASRTLVKEGDVLVSITADLGRTAVIPKGLKPAHINQHLALLRLKRERISPFYLASFLASIGGQLQFARLNREGVKAGLNFDDLRSLHILLPSLETQMKYDSFFINQTSTLNRYKQGFDAAQSLFNSLLQRAFRG